MDRPSSIDSVYTLLAKQNWKHASVYTEIDNSSSPKPRAGDLNRHVQETIASQRKGKALKR